MRAASDKGRVTGAAERSRRALGTETPRVLIALGTDGAWSRGTLRGFMAVASERDWMLLHYDPKADLSWLSSEWAPAAAVIGPELDAKSMARFFPAALVSVTVDRTAEGVPSVCLDEQRIATLAFDHLLGTGLRDMTTFRFDESAFAIARERAFVERARAAGIRTPIGWGADANVLARHEDPTAMTTWLRGLPKPCGVFTCTDGWGRTVARYARLAGLRVPEDLALVGADNDVLECELVSPPLSSVMIPWNEVGRAAANLVKLALEGRAVADRRVVISPTSVVARRSSDVLAVEDALVAEAVRWIRNHAERRLTVPMVARAVGGGRQRLERRFRSSLGRTVQHEIRRAHVESAKRLLETSDAGLPEIARRSGFSTAALLNVAFRRELGVAPGEYRRRVRRERVAPDDD
jgi:LacI family transcriptional regulator